MRCVVLVTVFLIFAVTTVNANEIILKRTFFGGWKYSVDGMKYEKVGYSGAGLKSKMAGNETALHEMNDYAKCKTWSLVTGIPGWSLLGWTLIKRLDDSQWKDSYTTMYAIGIPLSVAAVVFEEISASKLQKAVRIYNGQEKSSALPAPGVFASRNGALGISLNWKF